MCQPTKINLTVYAFQFAGIAEEWLSRNDFAALREWTRHPLGDRSAEILERHFPPELSDPDRTIK